MAVRPIESIGYFGSPNSEGKRPSISAAAIRGACQSSRVWHSLSFGTNSFSREKMVPDNPQH